MKLHIDNIDGFNDIFGTNHANVNNGWYEISFDGTDMGGNESDFWAICRSTQACRRFSVMTEAEYNSAVEHINN